MCAKTLQVEGQYCLVDKAWRSSSACAALGALLVIGSEESVSTMILITLIRMKATLRSECEQCELGTTGLSFPSC